MNNTLNILSLNVRGINEKKKRQKVFFWLKQQNFDIYLLQETHLGTERNKLKWSNEWSGKSFWTVNSTNSKGVSILLNKKCNYNVVNVSNCDDGRIISVQFEGFTDFNIVNLYAPNNDAERKHFLKNIVSTFLLRDMQNFLAGDFNCTLYDEDRHDSANNIKQTHSKEIGRYELENIMNEYEMCETYSRWKPEKRNFTYFKPNSIVRSRIDFIITSNYMYPWVTEAGTKVASFSDHNATYVKFNVSNEEKGPGRWKMNSSVIKSKLFGDTFQSFWDEWILQKEKYDNILDWWSETKHNNMI